MGKKTITVNIETWKELSKMKIDLGLKSLDDVIWVLIRKWRQ
jgi:predicted CopG family antitoxin